MYIWSYIVERVNANAIPQFQSLGSKSRDEFPHNGAGALRCDKAGRVARINKDLEDSGEVLNRCRNREAYWPVWVTLHVLECIGK